MDPCDKRERGLLGSLCGSSEVGSIPIPPNSFPISDGARSPAGSPVGCTVGLPMGAPSSGFRSGEPGMDGIMGMVSSEGTNGSESPRGSAPCTVVDLVVILLGGIVT